MTGIPQTPEAIDAAWLTDTLRAGGHISRDTAVAAVDAERIAEGAGFVGLLARLRLRYADDRANGPKTLIAKVPSADPGSRALATTFGLYEREVRFYAELAPLVELRTPACYCSAMDGAAGEYLLLLEDLDATGAAGDQVRGCTREDARLAVSELARFHAAWWESPRLDAVGWLQRGTDVFREPLRLMYPALLPRFMELYGERLPAPIAAAMPGLDAYALAVMDAVDRAPTTLAHGDYRLDNLFFGRAGSPYRLAAVDWQSVNRGAAAFEVPYFIVTNLTTEQRRAMEMDLLGLYVKTLREGGVSGIELDQLLADYRRTLLMMLAGGVITGTTLQATNERGLALFEAIFDRFLTAIVDLNSLALLHE